MSANSTVAYSACGNDRGGEGVSARRCKEKPFNNLLFWELRARSRYSQQIPGKRRIPRSGAARKSLKSLPIRLGRKRRRWPPKGWGNNKGAEIGAAAWEAAVAWEAVGSVFLAAVIRVAEAVIPAVVAVIPAVVAVIPAVEVIRVVGDIRQMAEAKGDIPTMILAAVAVRVR